MAAYKLFILVLLLHSTESQAQKKGAVHPLIQQLHLSHVKQGQGNLYPGDTFTYTNKIDLKTINGAADSLQHKEQYVQYIPSGENGMRSIGPLRYTTGDTLRLTPKEQKQLSKKNTGP